MKLVKIAFAATVMTALLTTAVFAQRPQGNQGDRENRGDRQNRRFTLPIIGAIDADGDGEITTAEIDNAAKALKELDENKDGKLTREEYLGAFGRRPGGQGGPGGAGGGQGGGRGGPGGGSFIDRLMERDTNKDGKLSGDEISERMQGLVERADENKDGALSKEELEKAFQNFRGGRPGGGRPGQGDGARPRRPGGDGGEGGNRPRRPSRPSEDDV